MATQQGLYDSEAVAKALVETLTKAFNVTENRAEYEEKAVPALRNVLESCLKEYNDKYINTFSLYQKSVEDHDSTKVSFNNQISVLQKKLKREEERKEEEVNRAIAMYKQQRDEVTKQADKERGELELQKNQLEERKKEARVEIDKYKQEARDAKEERAETIKSWEEQNGKIKEFEEQIASLSKAHDELKLEAINWQEEANRTAGYKEQAESERDKAQADLNPAKQKNFMLTKKLAQVNEELESTKQKATDQEKNIKELKEELKVTTQELEKSRGSTPKNDLTGSAAKFEELGGMETPRSGSAVSRSTDRGSAVSRSTDRGNNDYVPRDIHNEMINEKNKEVADLKAERDILQNDSAGCQTALKKLQNEVAKKDNAKIRDLEKQIAASEARANKIKGDLAKQKDQIQDLEKQLKAAKNNDANHLAEVTALRDELKRVEEELQATKKELGDVTENFDAHAKLLSEAEDARDKLQTRYQAIEQKLEERNKAHTLLDEELHKTENARASLHRGVERMLQPDVDITELQGFSDEVLDLAKVRQKAFNMQEKLVPLALKAADDYRTITGRGLAMQGYDTTEQGRPYISRPDEFLDDIRNLYNTLTTRIREAQADINKSKESANAAAEKAVEIAAAQQTIDSLQKQVDTLENNSKDLEQMLKISQGNSAKYENDGADQSQAIKNIRALIRRFLANASPSLKDLEKLLVNLVKLQRTVPGAVPFGEDTERKAGEFEETRKQLDECRDERTRLQDRNKSIKDKFDDANKERKRLQSEVARLTAELKALRDRQTQTEEQAQMQLEEAFGRISGQLQTLRDESEDERNRHADETAELTSQLQTVRNRLEHERKDFVEQIKRRDADLKALQDSNDEEIARLGNDVTRLTGELQSAKDSCERERRRLEREVKRLTNELKNLRKSGEEERATHAEEVRHLYDDLQNLRDNSEQENRRLEQEVTRLEQEVTRHEQEVARLNAELQVLRAALGEQNDVIGGNAQQANRTREALNGQINVLDGAQLELMRAVENMSQQAVPQGRIAAATQRSLRRAREEIDMFKNLVDELTVQRDLLQDEVHLCEEAVRTGRQRLRPNPAAGAGAGAGGEAGNAGGRGGVIDGTRNFIGHTYDQLLITIRYVTLWGTLGSIFVMMVVVIIAEGRQHAEWQDANAHSRALWMTTKDKPTICLGPPNIDYFWHTLAVALSGRWAFR